MRPYVLTRRRLRFPDWKRRGAPLLRGFHAKQTRIERSA